MIDVKLYSALLLVKSMCHGFDRSMNDVADVTFRLDEQLGTVTMIRGLETPRSARFHITDLLALARLANVSFNEADDAAKLAPGPLRVPIPEGQEGEAMRKARLLIQPHPTTVAIVAKILQGKFTPSQQQVLDAYRRAGKAGLTNYALELELGDKDHKSKWRSRRAELEAAGLIVKTKAYREEAGRERVIYAIVEGHADEAAATA